MKVITIGKRLVPAEQVAFVEPFDPSSNPEFKPEKDFKGRLVLLNREIVLTEQSPQEFAAEHDLLCLPRTALPSIGPSASRSRSLSRQRASSSPNPTRPVSNGAI